MKKKLRQSPFLGMPLRVFMGTDLLMIVPLWLQFSNISAEAHKPFSLSPPHPRSSVPTGGFPLLKELSFGSHFQKTTEGE